jgi:hypothetical protein
MESIDSRKYANAEQTLPGRYPATSGSVHAVLAGTQALLVHQLFNELLNGIRGVQFETQVGMTESTLRAIFDEFNTWVEACAYDSNGVIVIRDASGHPIGQFERDYTEAEVRALRNMSEFVLLDLGQEEFFTRTGFTLVEAKQLLDLWNAMLLEPLHLEKQIDIVSH